LKLYWHDACPQLPTDYQTISISCSPDIEELSQACRKICKHHVSRGPCKNFYNFTFICILSGDLYVYLFVNEDQEFHRDGINIISEIKISYLQAILGCRLEVSTVDGPVELVIPPGTQPNTVMKLENRGVPRLGNPVSRGDQMLTVLIDIPTKILPDERELLEKLAKIKGDRTGKGGLEGFLGGLFKS
jgi:DnaJ-class molecular chaperone